HNWNFGDGSTATGSQASHVYEQNGTYKIALVIDDNSGTSCSADTDGFEATVNAKPVSVIRIS
ncbi:MAG: PKD repeat protein, partial [Candidatus Omnitrophota bacterium]